MSELLLTNNQLRPHKIPMKSRDFSVPVELHVTGENGLNHCLPLQNLEQHLSSLREAAPQPKPIAMMYSIRPCLDIYFL